IGAVAVDPPVLVEVEAADGSDASHASEVAALAGRIADAIRQRLTFRARVELVAPAAFGDAGYKPIWSHVVDGDSPRVGASSQNIVLSFAAVSGITWSTSQCSTILPARSKRKMSMPA